VPPSGSNCEDRDGSIKYLSLKPSTSTSAEVAATFSNICSIALPLHLINISALKENEFVIINWETDNEFNVDHFDIERSINGRNFQRINNMPAKNQAAVNRYQYEDLHPTQGINFYRIKMVDLNGTYKYSTIIKINMNTLSIFQVFPNPARNIVVLSGLTIKKSIRIRTIDGKILAQKSTTGESMSIDMSAYSPGIYIIEYDSGKDIQRQKIVKQ
jgi:hypothetical protein